MKITLINTYDSHGGAARAAYRLHKGLRQIGEDCQMLVRYKSSGDEAVSDIKVKITEETFEDDFFLSVIQQQYINAHRSDISNTFFSLPYPGCDLSKLRLIKEAHILNLHWMAYYQSPVTLQQLFVTGKPVVWTLHDQWPFTGGCHYSAKCKKYVEDCSGCPQLADDPFDLSAAVLADKVDLFRGANLTIVTPSRWLADCARASRLFRDLRIEVIPNSLETNMFFPMPKAYAKETLNIPSDTVTVLFGAENGEEKRKGFHELLATIRHCRKSGDFQGLVVKERIIILCFGHVSSELKSMDIPVMPLGYLKSDDLVQTAYSAADIFVLPSLEDNLPNTVLEALSCATPVVAFDVGGIPDVVIDNVTGKLAPVGDIEKMGDAIISLVFNPDQREEMGRNGRETMVKGYSLDIQARRYLSLYKELNLSSSSTLTALREGRRT